MSEKYIIEYKACGSPSASKLIEQVNLFILRGYQPFGNIVIHNAIDLEGTEQTWFYQPVVKYGDSPAISSDDATVPWKWEKPE